MSTYDDLFDGPAPPPTPAGALPIGSRYDSLFDPQPSSAPLLVRGARHSPDKAAEAAALARRYSLPPAVAAEFVEDYRAKAQADDARAAFDKAPRFGGWVEAQPERASLVQDDVGTLSQIERGVRDYAGAVGEGAIGRGAGSTLTGFGRIWDISARAIAAPFIAVGGERVREFLNTPIPAWLDPSQMLLKRPGEALKAVGASMAPEQRTFGTDVASGLGQVGFQVVQQMLTGGIGSLSTLFAQGADVMGEKVAGDDVPQAQKDLAVLGGAGVTAVTEKWALDKILGPLAVPVKNKMAAALTRIGVAGASEGAQEMAENVLHDAMRIMLTNPDAEFTSLGDIAYEGGVGAAVGAIARGLVESALHVRTRGSRTAMEAAAAENGATQAAALARLGEAAKLKGRDAETFRELVAEIADEQGDAPVELFIDGRDLQNALNQSGVTRAELEAVAPIVARQKDAADTGAVVRVPVSEFLSAGEAITAPLVDLLRTSPGAMNRAEAKTVMADEAKRLEEAFEQEVGQAERGEAFRQAISGVQQGFESELNAAKRFTPTVNKAYATLLANFYGTQAARTGMTPEDFARKYRVRITSSAAQGEFLDQAAYHGTVHAVDKFTTQKIGSGEGAQAYGWGMYFAKSRDVADFYRRTVAAKAGVDGRLYEVDVPEDTDLLDYDARLADQPEAVRTALASLGFQASAVEIRDNKTGKTIDTASSLAEARRRITQGGLDAKPVSGPAKMTGKEVYAELVKSQGSAEAASRALLAAGVPGMRYLDAASRGAATQQTHNYVIFDDSAVRITGVLNQGATPRAQIGLPANFDAAPAVISLLSGADLTSFLHESGHLFLEVQADLAAGIQAQIDAGASVTDTERGIVEDMNRLLKWFEIKGSPERTPLQAWQEMTLDQKRESHEKFARGFEAYAMEGNAPAIDLQGIFQQFRAWLVSVYKTLAGLNVKLDDDVRAVMSRMLATDEAIAEAEAQRAMGPLFATPEQAGMTLEEFNAYHAVAKKTTEDAKAELATRSLKDMKWVSRARDKALKARQDEVEALRSEMRATVSAEVYAEPVYQAWQFLTSKSDEAGVAGKLRTDDLREMYGTGENAEWRRLSSLRMTSDASGINPEIVAEDFGFDSADALVKALFNAMPPAEVIDARTDQRMLEEHGDISSKEALDRAVDEAVFNEARARFVATELKALQAAGTVKERRGRATVDMLAKAAKNYAQQIVARQRVRDLRPSQYAAASARNARLAEKALASDKMDEAAMHKRNQLVNHYASKAAYEAQAEVKKLRAYLSKFDKQIKAIDREYQDQIDQMLEGFDLKQVSLKEVDRRKALGVWVAEQQALGAVPDITPELLSKVGRQSYKDMTVEEMRGLADAVKQIEHLGRLKNRLLTARDKKAFDEVAAEIAASIVEHGGKPRPVQLEERSRFAKGLESFWLEHRKLSSLARQMDGNRDDGPMYERLIRPMNERVSVEDVMIEEATTQLAELYAPILKMRGGVAGGKVFIPEINASLTRGGRLSVALNWGNADNRQRLLSTGQDGPWTEAQAHAILKTLTAKELEFVNATWRFLDSYWPQVAAKQERVTGAAPEKVEAAPFVLTSSDGVEVPMRGGYYPIVYSTERSGKARKQEAAQLIEEMKRGALGQAMTRRGHTKARLDEVKRPLKLDLDVITQHTAQVVHDLVWHEWLIDANRLLGSDAVSGAIERHYGTATMGTFYDAFEAIAVGDLAAQTAVESGALWLRANVSRATMGLSLTTAFLQPFGLTQSMVRIGVGPVLRGAARWAGDAAQLQSSMTWIAEKSDFMRLRAKTFNRELREINAGVEGRSKAAQMYDGLLFVFMKKMQMVADVPTWIGQYEKTMSEGPSADTDEARAELEAKAVAMADRAVREAQGSGHIADLSELQRKNALTKILTQFYSYFNVTLNLAIEQTAATDFKNPRAVAGWLADMGLLLVIPAVLPAMVLYGLRGGPDEEGEEDDIKRWVKWQAGYLLGLVVGARELSGAVEGFPYSGPPVGRAIGNIGKAGQQTAQGELDEPLVLSYANAIGTVLGLPMVQIMRSYKGWKAWDEGEEGAGPGSVLIGPPPKD